MLIGVKKLLPPRLTRLPISIDLLLQIIRVLPLLNLGHWDTLLYIALCTVAYVGCFRVSELIPTEDTEHAVRAEHVSFICMNNCLQTLVIRLLSHKCSMGVPPPIHLARYPLNSRYVSACPVKACMNYLSVRGRKSGYFFLKQHGYPPTRNEFSKVLKLAVLALGKNEQSFDTHSFRIGKCSDWIIAGISPVHIMTWGRWSSDAMYSYIKPEVLAPPPPTGSQ